MESELEPGSSTGVRPPWGVAMTLLLGGAIFLFYSLAQALAMVPLVLVASGGRGVSGEVFRSLIYNGLNLSLATSVACPVMVLACAAAAWARQGPALVDYFAVRTVGWGRWVGWSLASTAVAVGLSLLNDALGRQPPEFVARTYETAAYLPWFCAGVGICAPVAEEVLFRGFLYAGLAASWMRDAGAIAVTTVLFVLLHAGQYEWPDLVELGIMGGLFGVARGRTGSLVVPVAMHVTTNLTALALYGMG